MPELPPPDPIADPALELRQRIGQVFDNHLFNSWEIGSERLFYDWLARGTRDPTPFLDNRGIITEEYYRRLCGLRDLADGWFYWRHDTRQVVFVPLAEWEAISASWPSLLEQACAEVRDHAGP
jgi:hypothetical protein